MEKTEYRCIHNRLDSLTIYQNFIFTFFLIACSEVFHIGDRLHYDGAAMAFMGTDMFRCYEEIIAARQSE